MQSVTLLCFAAVMACAYAQVSMPPGYAARYPDHYYSKNVRHPRDLSWENKAGRGKVFGTLGSNDYSLYGRGGYKQDIFDNNRGHLAGQAYGSRVLGAGGDSSVMGGKLDWNNPNDNVRAGVDLHKEIGGGSGMRVTGEGVWKLDPHNTLSVGGYVKKNFGHDRPEVGIQGTIEG